MNNTRVAAALAGIGVLTLATLPVTQAERPELVDPLFGNAGQAACTAAQAGSPALLARLILAQAEIRPFQPEQQLPAKAAAGTPPLYKDLGTLHVAVTTASAQAQAYFDQGMRLAFAFNHAEAGRAFRAAQQFDPDCTMCYWGEALVLGPNINAPMFADAVAPAAAAARAVALSARASPAEQALIKAVSLRYAAAPPAERAPLDQAYAQAMTQAARAFPNDDTIQVLFAESLMDLSPWNYWEAGGSQPGKRTTGMIGAPEHVLERNPAHPGAIHYYLHVMEASIQPGKALPHARRLARLIPGAGHLVHMPSRRHCKAICAPLKSMSATSTARQVTRSTRAPTIRTTFTS